VGRLRCRDFHKPSFLQKNVATGCGLLIGHRQSQHYPEIATMGGGSLWGGANALPVGIAMI
jgi:hypothetical protein